ncbi:hypothetical protein RCO48_20175 [Peribacillus frigoritolerans]|nr:hypothetical protein [Peribacillus frigoritolerans]
MIIAVLTTTILLTTLFTGSQYILTKRLENQDGIYEMIHGANISYGDSSYNYNLFSVTKETTYHKSIGDRSIVWDKKDRENPIVR